MAPTPDLVAGVAKIHSSTRTLVSTLHGLSDHLQTVVMVPQGDIILNVHSEGKRFLFQIDSGVLCFASPVFRTMIGKYSCFKKEASANRSQSGSSRGSEHPYKLILEDDNPRALAVVLGIIHMMHQLVPKVVDEHQLYEIAVICDKYQMSKAVSLWVDKWVPLLVSNESIERPTVTGHKWLFISYVFQRRELFNALTREIILTATISTESATLVIMSKDGTWMNEHIPKSIVDAIGARRQQCIDSIMELVQKTVGKYSKPSSGSLQCMAHRKEERCDSLVLGFLIRAFILRDIYPVASTKVLHKSVRDLIRVFDHMDFPSFTYYHPHMNSIYCRGCIKNKPNGNIYLHIDPEKKSWLFCGECSSKYTVNIFGPNHSGSCSPTVNFSKAVTNIYDEVEGLHLDTFIASTNAGRLGYSVAIVGELQDLWAYAADE